MPYYRPGWFLVLLSLLQIATAAGLGVLQPLVIRWVVDQVLTAGHWNLLIGGSVAVVGLAAIQGTIRFGQRYTMELVSQRVIYELRSHLYQHLIAFARALCADPAILILDEATSNIYTYTEQIIQSAMKTLLSGRTSFVIAHRLSTIVSADRIYYIDGGQVVEEGTHEELLKLNGRYAKLYLGQFNALQQTAVG